MLELANPLQRSAFQPLRITGDGTLPLPLDTGHAAIECGNKLPEIMNKGLVGSGLHRMHLRRVRFSVSW